MLAQDVDEHDDKAWSPYPSKLMFLLDTIDNLPRLRISSSIMKVILWLLRVCGIRDVPSYKALRKVQEDIQKDAGIPTLHRKSPQGHTFSFNDPRALIANVSATDIPSSIRDSPITKDWSNPLISPYIRVYPVIPRNGIVSEIWHAAKWRHEMDRHLLSPMYASSDRHYYIDEPAQLKDSRMVIPVRWLENEEDGEIWADAWSICHDDDVSSFHGYRHFLPVPQLLATVNDTEIIQIRANDLRKNFLDLMDNDQVPRWNAATITSGHPQRMPNPDRALAQGNPLYTSFIDVFGDDVSGNKSKSWNKHWNVYITHRNLPRQLLQQNYNIRFVSTSPYASVPEQFHGIQEIIRSVIQRAVLTQTRTHVTHGQINT